MAEHEGTNTQASSLMMRVIVAFDLVFILSEMSFYVVIYRFIFNHNRTMLTTSIISVETFKHRQRLSVFSVTVHFYCFIVKIIFMTVVNLALMLRGKYSTIQVLEMANCLRIIQFAILSVVQVSSTNEMRREFMEKFTRMHH